jgi:hypothetical protein
MKLLIVSNCITQALKWNINYLAPNVEVDAFDISQFGEKISESEVDSTSYDIIIGLPVFFDKLKQQSIVYEGKALILPAIHFNAFHPDMVYFKSNEELVKTSMDTYNSMIILASYLKGYEPSNVQKLFCDNVYNQLGYYDLWKNSANEMVEKFSFLNFDVNAWLRKLSTQTSFMYTINHPKMFVVAELTKFILKYLKVPYFECSESTVNDYFSKGPIWPVYDEIATRFGIQGHYRFRKPNLFHSISLNKYVVECFERYSELGVTENNITIINEHVRFSKVLNVVGELK